MKSIYTILILSFLLQLSSCNVEELSENDSVAQNQEQLLFFKVALSQMEQNTKGKNEVTGLDPQNFYVLVFDEQGLFIERSKAQINGTGFRVQLTASSKRRIVHFVGNYDFSGFSDASSKLKSEKEIVAGMQMINEVAYWKRLDLTTGISVNSFPSSVELIRNIARISLVNSLGSGYPRLENIDFAIINQLDYGTVAPFKKADGSFPEGWVTEANSATLTGVSSFSAQPQYVYEKINKSSVSPLSIIIRGNFKSSALSVPVQTFYKIDFVDNASPCNVLPIDIIRNMHYMIILKSVSKSGYSDMQQAISSPASNNIINSIELQDLKTISDGTSVLSVDRTSYILVKSNSSYEVNYNYYPNGTSQPIDNSNMSIQLVNDDLDRPVLGSINTSVPGKITFTTDQFPKQGNRTGYIRICKNGLTRIVKLTYKYPYVFEMPYLTPNSAQSGQNNIIDLKFTIPNSIPSSEFPMNISISTTKLSPDPASGLQIEAGGTKYKFIYIATGTGEKSIRFRTVYSNSSHECSIENPLFSDAFINFESGTGNSRFVSGWFNVKPRYIAAGQSVILNLFVPASASGTTSLIVNNTSGLELDPSYSMNAMQQNIIVGSNQMTISSVPYNTSVVIYLRAKATDYQTGAITISGAGYVTTSDLNKAD
ncbi:MAG: hypothetical protein ACRCX1_04040 [Bacteroidales bacterium]